MRFYAGPVPGDERPIGGGGYNKEKIGHEIYNFKESGGRLYGFFQPHMASNAVALERIDPSAAGTNKLKDILVIFVAPRPQGGQAVVGWFRNAEVLRKEAPHSPGKPKGFGHYCSAQRQDCVLLPYDNRSLVIPRRNGMGQSNVCYPLDAKGQPKNAAWMQQVLAFIDDYRASDILVNPEADAEKEIADATEKALARSKGQGFARTPQERKALEDHAMKAAMKYFRRKRYHVEDVSKTRSYDLVCRQGATELHVEVKGTKTDGDAVVLTKNEVKHACDPQNSCALFILHSIRFKGKAASGGKSRVLLPWHLQKTYLTPMSYTYRLS